MSRIRAFTGGVSILALAVLAATATGAAARGSDSAQATSAGAATYYAEVGQLDRRYLADAPLAPHRSDARRAGSDAKDPRVVAGHPVTVDEVPWQVGLTTTPLRGDAFRRQICGGTLVAPTIVVTAAHCAFAHGGFEPASDFGIVSGRTTLSNDAEGQEQRVESILVPTSANGRPRYNPRTSGWDAIVMQLSAPAVGTPILLAGPDESALWAKGQQVLASGWGSLAPGRHYPENLHAGELKILSDSVCRRSFGGYNNSVMLCVSGKPVDTCPGDSGGPIVATAADGTMRLIGDTSYGVRRCGTARGSVYGEIAGDPMRSALQKIVLKAAGIDIVGSGATP